MNGEGTAVLVPQSPHYFGGPESVATGQRPLRRLHEPVARESSDPTPRLAVERVACTEPVERLAGRVLGVLGRWLRRSMSLAGRPPHRASPKPWNHPHAPWST